MADLSKYIQAQKFALAVGISTADTSITLSSFNFPNGEAIASGDLGEINYGTLEPTTSREEIISFTGITANSDGTVTLTGVTRGLGFGAVDTYSEQSNLKLQHGAGSTFLISNNPAFYDRFVNKANDETVTGTLSVPTPTAAGHAATKAYVDNAALGGATVDNIVVGGTSGESVAAGDLIYFDDTDNEWKKTDADTLTTIDNVLLGIAQGAGSDGASITDGVLIFGVDDNLTGLTAGDRLYASNTAGAISNSAGTNTKIIGWAKSATEIYFDPWHGFSAGLPTVDQKAALAGGGNFGAPSDSNKFLTEDYIPSIGPLLETGVSKKITSNTDNAEIASSTTVETNIFSTTIDANTLGTNNFVKFKVFIENLTIHTSLSSSVTFRLKLGATTIASIFLDNPDQARTMIGSIEGVIIAAGSTSAQRGTLSIFAAPAVDTPDQVILYHVNELDTGTATEDSTSNLTLSLTLQWGTTSDVNDFVPAGHIIELVS